MKRICLILMLSSISYIAWAQTPTNTKENKQKNIDQEITSLEKIVITKRGYYIDPVYYPLSVPASEESTTSVVSAEEITAAHKQTIIETIENVPSVILEKQGRKYPTRIKIRGERNVNVLINGATPGQDYKILGALPSTLIEEIDVIRDSSYLAYGSPNTSSSGGTPGYGGVVNVKLKRPEKENGTEVKLEYGNFNTQDESVTTAGKLMDISYLLNIEHTASNGPKNENANRASTGITTLLNRQYGDYDSRINLLAHFDDGYFGFQKSLSFTTRRYDIWEYDPSMDAMVNLDILHAWNDRSSTNLTLYHDYQQARLIQNQSTRQTNPTYPAMAGANDIQNRDISSGVNIRQTFSMPTLNTLRFGAQYNNWNCPTGKLFYEGTPRKEQDFGAYAHDELRLLEDKLILDGGLRWDLKYVGRGINYTETGGTTGTYSNKWLDPNINSAIGVTIWPFKKHGFSARYSNSSQANAIYADQSQNLLASQKENRYDLSYIGKWSKEIIFTLTGFQRDISNRPYSVSGQNYYQATNVKRYGAEMEIKGTLLDGLSYFFNYSQIYSRDKTNQKKDSAIPPYVANIGLDYQRNGWEFNTTVKRVSGYEDNSLVIGSTYVDIGDYWQGDINGGYTFESKAITHKIYAGVRNVGNARYQTVPGYEDYGLTFYGGDKIKF